MEVREEEEGGELLFIHADFFLSHDSQRTTTQTVSLNNGKKIRRGKKQRAGVFYHIGHGMGRRNLHSLI